MIDDAITAYMHAETPVERGELADHIAAWITENYRLIPRPATRKASA
ncbi:hypothetical protein QSJ18_18285 [Gordonia sp. ABSL1-1]|nr:hypothetical protein [Gordonia sp. ABSL1-1]MDL9938699.1 hypothetical protein [Gordonia sp. ABSL1-1]